MKKNMNRSSIVIYVVVSIAFLAIGGVAGWYLNDFYTKDPASLNKVAAANADQAKIANIMTSDATSSTRIFGKVNNIVGRNVTLAYNKEIIQITIKNDAPVFALDYSGKVPTQRKLEFKNIKIGDQLSVGVDVSKTFQLEGVSILVVPMQPLATK